jgi:hypothetical protein
MKFTLFVFVFLLGSFKAFAGDNALLGLDTYDNAGVRGAVPHQTQASGGLGNQQICNKAAQCSGFFNTDCPLANSTTANTPTTKDTSHLQ